MDGRRLTPPDAWTTSTDRARSRAADGPHFNLPAAQPRPKHQPHRRNRLALIGECLRAIYLTRFSILVAVILLLIGPFGTEWMPSMLGAIFLLNTPMQMLWVTIISLLVAAMTRVSWGVTLLNAPKRFHDCVNVSRECLSWAPWDWIPVTGLGLLPPLYCFFATRADWERAGLENFPQFAYMVAIATGVVAVALMLFIATAVQERLSGPEHTSPGLLPFEWLRTMNKLRDKTSPGFVLNVEQPLARLLGHLGPGYTREALNPSTGETMLRLAPGHFQSMACLLLAFAAYVALGSFAAGLQIDKPWYPPALCLALQAILLLGWTMSALAYYLDRFRVPVMGMMLGVSWFSYWGFGVDHYYHVTFADAAIAQPARPPRLEEVIHPNWYIPRDKDRKRTLVVVTASGGGIQASAWTAKVLCGLHERYPRHFAQSLGLISGVSGGSVGTMFYLVHLQNGRDPLDDGATRAILEASRHSSIDAAVWGIAYPDLARNVAPPLSEFCYEKYTDRGSAIEKAWSHFVTPSDRAVVGSTNTYLHDLVEPMKRHQLPVVVFNSVLVETGQRFLISPVSQRYGKPPVSSEPQEFMDLYRGAQLSLATGARLSATFPFVSPICRPTPSPQLEESKAYHVADGAYADNEGIVTAVDWMNQLCEFYSTPENEPTRPFDRVLFVRIQPFPVKTPAQAKSGKGWQFATMGPLTGMLKVRQASQAERGNLEADLLAATRHLQNETQNLRISSDKARELASQYAPKSELKQLDATLAAQESRLTPPTMNTMPFHTGRWKGHGQHSRSVETRKNESFDGIEVDAITITFPLVQPEDVIPLSWKLSEFDKQRIDKAWQKLLDNAADEQNPLVRLDKYFPQRPFRTARHNPENPPR
jgi:hypothetical protein